ncbi:serine/threonine-protein kinase [Paucibacter sp. DJ1R-11]|uniref:serine/threonine-protein kinase n=1 Tax=Paucibacter sp. DJ1R-11 TaxID=2893556 RepID=UPI0021E4E18A|nr:serine/threonine-protein kinase [Paucibacter sp. DJ1R-11]MCV2362760.1 serine/threonine-protein kinase [Paucibacter sp. DJ1R-11]
MSADRAQWQRLSALLHEALDLSAAARSAWLERLHQEDAPLARQVADLLANDATLPSANVTRRAATAAAPESPTEPPVTSESAHSATPTTPQPPPRPRLGAWCLLERIGQGGMGEVWLAERGDGLYQAKAAIKLLRSDLDARQLSARFARERALLGRLNHPAIARLLDAGIGEAGQAYLVLEHVSGQALDAHVREHCPSVRERVQLLIRVAEAVDHAHAQLVVHRDLKPSNVLVMANGQPKLLDFGIASLLEDEGNHDLTRQAGLSLTLNYAAPEQVLGEAIDTRADVFALGVMLFELLCGHLPFAPRGSKRAASEHALLHDEPRRLLPAGEHSGDLQDPLSPGPPLDAKLAQGDLEAVVSKALRKRPADRYGSVRELINDLQAWLEHRPVSVRREDWRHRSRLLLRRHAVLAGAAAMVVLSLSLGLGAATWQWQRAERSARQSDHVTRYLMDLLASATPEAHGGQWPTVLQLLNESRAELPQKFADDPDTRLRLLEVFSNTYAALNHFDAAFPLAEQWLKLALERHGEGTPEALKAQLGQAWLWQISGHHVESMKLLEPQLGAIVKTFGEVSEPHSLTLQVLAANAMHLGRLDDAERILTQSGALQQRLHPGGALERADYLNNLRVLRNEQGRPREALAALEGTRDLWSTSDPKLAMQMLVIRQNHLTDLLRLNQFEGALSTHRTLVEDMNRVLGPGNALSFLEHRSFINEYFLARGQYGEAHSELQALIDKAAHEKAWPESSQLRLLSMALLAQTRHQLQSAGMHKLRGEQAMPAPLRQELMHLLDRLRQNSALTARQRSGIALDLAELALAYDEAALAELCMQSIEASDRREAHGKSRLLMVEAQLARAQGELSRSRSLQDKRVTALEASTDPASAFNWSAHLDLAYTQLLQGDTQAAQASLERALARRPATLPGGHPLDSLGASLQAWIKAGTKALPSKPRASLGAAFISG